MGQSPWLAAGSQRCVYATCSPQSWAGSEQRDRHQCLPNKCWLLLSTFSHLVCKVKQLERSYGDVLSYACISDVAAMATMVK